jgi:hypothetical protein
MTTDRAGYIAGLRKLADLLEQHDDLPLPYEGSSSSGGRRITFYYFGETAEAFKAAARMLPGPLTKEITDGALPTFTLTGAVAGVHFQATAHRDLVCERVVVGTDEVTEMVPDPAVEVPLVPVTRVVEQVEWRCAPVLAGSTGSSQR